jgi:hypothetical protein
MHWLSSKRTPTRAAGKRARFHILLQLEGVFHVERLARFMMVTCVLIVVAEGALLHCCQGANTALMAVQLTARNHTHLMGSVWHAIKHGRHFIRAISAKMAEEVHGTTRKFFSLPADVVLDVPRTTKRAAVACVADVYGAAFMLDTHALMDLVKEELGLSYRDLNFRLDAEVTAKLDTPMMVTVWHVGKVGHNITVDTTVAMVLAKEDRGSYLPGSKNSNFPTAVLLCVRKITPTTATVLPVAKAGPNITLDTSALSGIN